MKAKFGKLPLHSEIIITAETRTEAEHLSRWHNCILTAQNDFSDTKHPDQIELRIVKEI